MAVSLAKVTEGARRAASQLEANGVTHEQFADDYRRMKAIAVKQKYHLSDADYRGIVALWKVPLKNPAVSAQAHSRLGRPVAEWRSVPQRKTPTVASTARTPAAATTQAAVAQHTVAARAPFVAPHQPDAFDALADQVYLRIRPRLLDNIVAALTMLRDHPEDEE